MTVVPAPKGRAEKMRARMADPAFKAKALANLEKGRAARAAKRKSDLTEKAAVTQAAKASSKAKTTDRTAADSSAATKGSGGQSTESGKPATTAHRAFGVGRWR